MYRHSGLYKIGLICNYLLRDHPSAFVSFSLYHPFSIQNDMSKKVPASKGEYIKCLL